MSGFWNIFGHVSEIKKKKMNGDLISLSFFLSLFSAALPSGSSDSASGTRMHSHIQRLQHSTIQVSTLTTIKRRRGKQIYSNVSLSFCSSMESIVRAVDRNQSSGPHPSTVTEDFMTLRNVNSALILPDIMPSTVCY